MKRLLFILISTTLILSGCSSPKGNTYALATIVTDTDFLTDTVTCTDNNGNQWKFEGVSDWICGDGAALTMSDNGTEIIYDDVILGAKFFRPDILNEISINGGTDYER